MRELCFDKDQLYEEKYKGYVNSSLFLSYHFPSSYSKSSSSVLFGLGGHTSITGAASFQAAINGRTGTSSSSASSSSTPSGSNGMSSAGSSSLTPVALDVKT